MTSPKNYVIISDNAIIFTRKEIFMKKYIDLHVHSTVSDGTLNPSELVHYAQEKKLAAFALTDHDTTDGLEEAMKAALGSDLE